MFFEEFNLSTRLKTVTMDKNKIMPKVFLNRGEELCLDSIFDKGKITKKKR